MEGRKEGKGGKMGGKGGRVKGGRRKSMRKE